MLAKVACADVAWVMQMAAFGASWTAICMAWHALLIYETYSVDVE